MTTARALGAVKARNLLGAAIGLGIVAFASVISYSLFSPSQATAAVPTTMNFQGRLTNSSNVPVADGLYNMKFRIFSVSTGGTAVWSETRETTDRVQVTGGLFSVQLGSVTPLSASVFSSSTLYFEMELPTPGTATCSTASCQTWTEGAMTPRSQLSTSAFAFNSETLDGLDSTQLARTDQANIFTGTQTVQADSTAALQVQNATGTTAYFGVDTSSGLVKTESLQALTAGTRTVNRVVTVVDATGVVGYYSSIALGSDGFARISYHDGTNSDLKFVQCTNADCTTKNTTTVDSTGLVGRASSLALGSDGFARISYYDITNSDLKFIQCTNADCTTKNTTTVDSAGSVGEGSSLALGSDGFARISYYDSINGDLKFVQCTNAACTTKSTVTLGSTGYSGQNSSLALGSDGFARISYYDSINAVLKFTQCTNADCTTKNTTTVDSAGSLGRDSSLALGSDGFARISYYDGSAYDLKFIQCTNADCTTKNTTTVDSAGNVGEESSLALGSDGFARISYYDGSAKDLKYARLTSATGGVVYAGSTIGTQASRYGRLYVTGADIQGGTAITVGAGSTEYALDIASADNILHATDGTGKEVIRIDKSRMAFETSTGDSFLEITDASGTYIGHYADQSVQQGSAALMVEKYGTGDGLFVTKGTEAGMIIRATSDWSYDVFTVDAQGGTIFRNATDSANAFQVQNSSGAGVLNVDTSISKVILADTEISAGKTLRVVGGATGTRPASPTEGMVYYDTDTKQLLTYANGKWQADRSTSTKIVAASNSSQALKDAADYVADGTGDQTEINSALTAASGGKVYLAEGAYYLAASISVPDNTTLAGAGKGTLITIPNAQNGSYDFIINSNVTTGTGVAIRDLAIDGNKANQTAGSVRGIYLNNMGGGTGATARDGGSISNVSVANIYNQNAIFLSSSHRNTVTGSTVRNNGGNGIALFNSTNNTITNNTAYGNTTDGFQLSSSANYNTLSGNTSQANGGRGLRLSSNNNNTISGNTFQGNLTHGVEFSGANNTTFTGNTVNGSTSYGVYLWSSSFYNTISSNTITSNASIGIALAGGGNNVVSSNTIRDSGGATANNGITVSGSDNDIISDNNITDSSATGNNYAISISASTADNTYLTSNVLGTGTVNDLGTNTIYANQLDANGKLISSKTTINSAAATAFEVQNTAASETFLTVDATINQLKVGNSTAAAGANVTVLVLDNALSTTTPTGVAGAMYYDSSNNKFKCYTTSWVDCDTGGAGSGATTALDNLASTNINTALNTTAGNLTLQTTTSGNIVLNAAGTTELMDDTNVGGNLTVAAGKSLTLTGGTTASRPASPTEGMVYYDTDTKQLLTYANGKWQADRSTSTKIVAASNSSQALKDAADYVADGTGDQTEINSALTAAAGGKVYLAEGTYTINASISVPSNTTLTGAGAGTLVTIPNGHNVAIDAVSVGATSHGAVVRDLRLDGNKTNNTSGEQNGISVGANGSATLTGTTLIGVSVSNFRSYGIYILGGKSHKLTNSSVYSSTTAVYLSATNSIISDNTVASNGYGIYIQSGSGNSIEGNTISDNTSGAAIAIESSSLNTVEGNILSDNADYGISVLGVLATPSTNNVISSNVIRNSGGASTNGAVSLSSYADNNTVTGNNISDTSATVFNYSIYIQYSTADNNYLADNILGTGTINDFGTGTIYANQLNSSGQLINSASGGLAVKLASGSSNDLFQAQNSSGTAIMKVTSAGAIQAASFDAAAAGALTIGETNATSVQITKDTVVKLTSTSAFQVQNAGGTALLAVDTSAGSVTIGSAANGVVMTANGISFTGTARPTSSVTLTPEYAGATFIGDGTNNTGTLTSDFCSGSSRMNVNATACGATDTRNYYQWSNTQATAQDYDIYVRYQVPSDYDTNSMTDLKILGWGTTSAGETVTVALHSDGTGTACSTSGNAVTANATWSSATVASPLGTCTIVAGDTVTFKVRVAAGQNNSARAGAISFSYRQKF